MTDRDTEAFLIDANHLRDTYANAVRLRRGDHVYVTQYRDHPKPVRRQAYASHRHPNQLPW